MVVVAAIVDHTPRHFWAVFSPPNEFARYLEHPMTWSSYQKQLLVHIQVGEINIEQRN